MKTLSISKQINGSFSMSRVSLVEISLTFGLFILDLFFCFIYRTFNYYDEMDYSEFSPSIGYG